MIERPILFSAPMVRAILDGRKTQTRRIVKLRGGADVVVHEGKVWKPARVDYAGYVDCPYGQPGDRLWVRETWNYIHERTPAEQEKQSAILKQCADGKVTDIVGAAMCLPIPSGEKKAMYAADFGDWARDPDSDLHWRPSIFMPRWASRIALEITGVRVERLQEISEADAIAEGIPAFNQSPSKIPRMHYATLWDKINAKRAPWASDPFVWVISFLRFPR